MIKKRQNRNGGMDVEWLLILIELAALAEGFWIAKEADIFFAGVDEKNGERKVGGKEDGT